MAAYDATQEEARQTLSAFIEARQPAFVAAGISVLHGIPFPSAKKSTDWYLANLAQHYGMQWATLDTKANHPAAALI